MKTKITVNRDSKPIHIETYPHPIPGDLYKSFIYLGKNEGKKIGGMYWSYLVLEDKKYCILHEIKIKPNYRRLGIATDALTEFLVHGFDECITEIDSKAGEALILKCGFKTDDGINYLWRNMPVKITKTNGKYKVSTPHGTKSKGTTKKKAVKQKRLLNAIDHGFKPRKK